MPSRPRIQLDRVHRLILVAIVAVATLLAPVEPVHGESSRPALRVSDDAGTRPADGARVTAPATVELVDAPAGARVTFRVDGEYVSRTHAPPHVWDGLGFLPDGEYEVKAVVLEDDANWSSYSSIVMVGDEPDGPGSDQTDETPGDDGGSAPSPPSSGGSDDGPPPAADRSGATAMREAMGMFAGGRPGAAVDRREDWLGTDIRWVQVSSPRHGDWNSWRATISGALSAAVNNPDRSVVLSLPMIVEDPVSDSDPREVRAGAAGLYDDNWQWLGDRVAQHGDQLRQRGIRLEDRLVLRPGWEHNAPWFRHSSLPDGHHGRAYDPSRPQHFADYFRRLHDLVMRPVTQAGHDVRFELNMARYGSEEQVASAFPTGRSRFTGRGYVDIVTLSAYDGGYNDSMTHERAWQRLEHGTLGLRWLASFADQHTGGALGIGEWGLVYRASGGGYGGGGDNPLYVRNMHRWLSEQWDAGRLQYHRYFDVDKGPLRHRLSPGGGYDFVEASREFRRLFGNQG